MILLDSTSKIFQKCSFSFACTHQMFSDFLCFVYLTVIFYSLVYSQEDLLHALKMFFIDWMRVWLFFAFIISFLNSLLWSFSFQYNSLWNWRNNNQSGDRNNNSSSHPACLVYSSSWLSSSRHKQPFHMWLTGPLQSSSCLILDLLVSSIWNLV